jgi:hypothetical protein
MSLDMEVVEIELEDAHKMQRAGFITLEHYQTFKYNVSNGMLKFGDCFTRPLGEALKHANLDDCLKIMRYWTQLCDQYALLYKMYLAKEAATNGI